MGKSLDLIRQITGGQIQSMGIEYGRNCEYRTGRPSWQLSYNLKERDDQYHSKFFIDVYPESYFF